MKSGGSDPSGHSTQGRVSGVPPPPILGFLGLIENAFVPALGILDFYQVPSPSTTTLRPALCPAKLHQAEGPAGWSECPCCVEWCRHPEDLVLPHTAAAATATQVVVIIVNFSRPRKTEAIGTGS